MKKILLLLIFGSNVFPWGPITHWHINKSISSDKVFCSNGMSPDLFWPLAKLGIERFKEMGERTHSPYPLSKEEMAKEEKFKLVGNDKENFAYIMKLYSLTNQEGIWSGWGAHIASDWVTHSPNFLSSHLGKNWDKKLEAYHHRIEYDMDYYLYLKEGGVSGRLRTNPELIWKTLVNKRLIELKRAKPADPDGSLTTEAIKYVNDKCPILTIKILAGLFTCIIYSHKIVLLGKKLFGNEDKFIKDWENSEDGKIALENFKKAEWVAYK